MPSTAPYGSWRSPITADLIVTAGIGLAQPRSAGDAIYWLEVRPTEGGRYVIVRRRPDGTTEDVNPPPFNARTRVHEYGGADYLPLDDGTVYFANFADQRLYVARPGAEPVALTHADAMRYADMTLDAARNRLICVREDHTRPEPENVVNTIAAIDLATGDETVLVEGSDFYAYARVSPDGSALCWLSWDHPNMPWDHAELRIARFDDGGALRDREFIAGVRGESVFQPEWSQDGRLYFVSDRTGWWNMYRWNPGVIGLSGNWSPEMPRVEAVVQMQAEFGAPLWQLGMTTYAFDGPDRIIAAYCVAGTWRLGRIDAATGTLTEIETPYTRIVEVAVRDGRALFFGASPDAPSGVVAVDLTTGAHEVLKRSSTIEIDAETVSRPQTIEFPTGDTSSPNPLSLRGEGGSGSPEQGASSSTATRPAGREARGSGGDVTTAFAFYYPPRNKDYVAPQTEKPPLIVMSHGGPTAATSPVLSPRVQYWTSRGFAVLDVNYGGSTGYGTEYRRRLNGKWGIVDVDDCVNGALYLVERGLVDGERLAITGGSAGGYTTLAALAFRDVFKAGASHYGVSDLEALATDTHKFESRYLDGLVGEYPERKDVYDARSPIHHVEGLGCPVIFFQGLEDRIVPPNQAEIMVDALKRKGVPVAYLPFEGEQHGFRRAENIKRSLEAELYFYGRIFGFVPADAIEPVDIANL